MISRVVVRIYCLQQKRDSVIACCEGRLQAEELALRRLVAAPRVINMAGSKFKSFSRTINYLRPGECCQFGAPIEEWKRAVRDAQRKAKGRAAFGASRLSAGLGPVSLAQRPACLPRLC